MATTLDLVAEGSSVYLNVSGVRTEFVVVHHGIPSDIYDVSCDGIWLLQKVPTEHRAWNSTRNNDYKSSEIHAYLNSEYLYKFDPYIQEKIKSVKIPYIDGVGKTGPTATGANGLQAKLFLLSTVEVGYVTSGRDDGACLSYFQDQETLLSKRVAYAQNGTAIGWWTRTPPAISDSNADYIKKDGYKASTATDATTYYLRPAFILPYDLGVDDSGNVVESKVTPADPFSGYTRLEYIETGSYGGLYIDTGFKPDYNTRLVMDFEKFSTDSCTPFGATLYNYDTTEYTGLYLEINSKGTFTCYYGADYAYVSDLNDIGSRILLDANKNEWTANGRVVCTLLESDYSLDYSLYLFGENNTGDAYPTNSKMRLYSCKIYDDGVLVRDYVPALRDEDEVPGLMDVKNGVFYRNAGDQTNYFIDGPAVGPVTQPIYESSAMIDGVNCKITQCLVNINGVNCPVAYGLTTIDGVTMTIPFGPSAETIEQYPSVVGNLTYTGSAQSPQWADYDSSKMSIGGTQSGTNAGSYTTTFTPLDGYAWPDGSTDAYSVTWSIAKAAGKVTLSKTSVSVGMYETTTFTVTRSGDGAISVPSSASGKATVTLSGTTVTVNGTAIGSATITVSVAEGTNHLAASATCAVTVAQMYTVTITGDDGAYMFPGSKNAAYFQINGTQYYGDNSVTLNVASGTSYRAYAHVVNPSSGVEAGIVKLNSKEVARGGRYDGKITSNTNVKVYIYDLNVNGYSVGYGGVDITTS